MQLLCGETRARGVALRATNPPTVAAKRVQHPAVTAPDLQSEPRRADVSRPTPSLQAVHKFEDTPRPRSIVPVGRRIVALQILRHRSGECAAALFANKNLEVITGKMIASVQKRRGI